MKILLKRTINHYMQSYPDASHALFNWNHEFAIHKFANFNEIKAVYRSASIIGNNRVVFNIKGNAYRLIVSMNFIQGACYIIWFGNHQSYDSIDAERIPFDNPINKK
jgi:mRNA interferase HigB